VKNTEKKIFYYYTVFLKFTFFVWKWLNIEFCFLHALTSCGLYTLGYTAFKLGANVVPKKPS